MTLNRAKIEFNKAVLSRLVDIPKLPSVVISYTVYPRTRALSDVANYCAVVDKFFSDVLVSAGKLEDDNFNYVQGVLYFFGSVDPINPRVTVNIYSKEEYEDYLRTKWNWTGYSQLHW